MKIAHGTLLKLLLLLFGYEKILNSSCPSVFYTCEEYWKRNCLRGFLNDSEFLANDQVS